MRRLAFATALSSLLLAAAPADARLGDSATVARELARRNGAKSVKVYMSHPFPADPRARVIAETWVAPDAGWTLDQANAHLKLLVGARRRLMVKTSRIELGWLYTFRYLDHVSARCVYENGRVRELSAQSGAYVEADAVEEKSATFVFPSPP
jgi:hypothetical protein